MATHIERPYHVAIVGSGPSGFFTAASLVKAADASSTSTKFVYLAHGETYTFQADV
jgi:uncharacterized NAD(P)/FAD-binding protein YdhS